MGAFLDFSIRVSNIDEVIASYLDPFEVSFIEDLQKHLNLKILYAKKGYWAELPIWNEEKQTRALQRKYFEDFEISFQKDMKRKVRFGLSQETGYFTVFMNTTPVVGSNEKSAYLFLACFYFLAKKVLELGGQNVILLDMGDTTEVPVEKEDDIEIFYQEIDFYDKGSTLVNYLNAPHQIVKHRPSFPRDWIIKSKYWLT